VLNSCCCWVICALGLIGASLLRLLQLVLLLLLPGLLHR
jgi:hypothetical protein